MIAHARAELGRSFLSAQAAHGALVLARTARVARARAHALATEL
jgi:hypothetical protein